MDADNQSVSYSELIRIYGQLRDSPLQDYGSLAFGKGIEVAYMHALKILKAGSRVALASNVEGKKYFAIEANGRMSRAINAGLFTGNAKTVAEEVANIGPDSNLDILNQCIYSLAITICVAIDINKTNDQKTPGTFFEILAGHLLSRRFGATPEKQIQILNLESKKKLPTDFIFDLGKGNRKFHIPVKTSTRERVIQVWAHQRVLDGVFGVGQIQGILVALAETKVDKAKREVVEICLPDQWLIYQMFIAQMKAAYYLDVPDKYAKLSESKKVRISVKPFSAIFFDDLES